MEPSVSRTLPKSSSDADRAVRSKTVFQIAQPPPSKRFRTGLRRPRILLQIQQLSEHRRPVPILDVLPSSYFAPRLAQRFPKIFKGKSALGPNDIIVTNSNSSEGISRTGKDTGLSSDGEASDSREVVGTICRQIKKPQEDIGPASAEICLDHGLVWKATPLPRGGYEFNATGADGSPLQARWVRRDRPHQRVSSLPNATLPVAKRFTFSILNPSARRHPVIASMTTESIEIHDQYPAAVAQNTLQLGPTAPVPVLADETSYFDIQDVNSKCKEPLIYTDHQLRSLIVITGIYVSLEEGWAQDAPHSQRRIRDQEMDSTTTVDNRAAVAKGNRASTQIFHKFPAVLPDETYVENNSPGFDRAYSTRTTNTKSSSRFSVSARLRSGKEDREASLTDDRLTHRSDGSSRTSSQGLPPYTKPRESTESLRVRARLPYEKSRFANVGGKEEAGIIRAPSTRSSKICRSNSSAGRKRPGFRRFFSLPCIGGAANSKVR